MNDIALLVVDMQTRLMRTIPDYKKIVDRTSFAIESCQLLKIPVIYTEQSPEKLGSTAQELLDIGLSGAPCFSKTAFSALGAPGVLEYLQENKIRHLIVVGVELSICVYQTILSGLAENFAITLLSDCLGGRRAEDTQAIIAALQSMQCHRLPSETIFYSALGGAEHPKFREFTELVKKYN